MSSISSRVGDMGYAPLSPALLVEAKRRYRSSLSKGKNLEKDISPGSFCKDFPLFYRHPATLPLPIRCATGVEATSEHLRKVGDKNTSPLTSS
jgi:hypothetical protein